MTPVHFFFQLHRPLENIERSEPINKGTFLTLSIKTKTKLFCSLAPNPGVYNLTYGICDPQ